MDANESSIQNAALNGDFDAVESKLNADPSTAIALDGDSRTVLHWACVSGSIDIFRLVLSLPKDYDLSPTNGFGEYHVNINAQDDGGWVSLVGPTHDPPLTTVDTFDDCHLRWT